MGSVEKKGKKGWRDAERRRNSSQRTDWHLFLHTVDIWEIIYRYIINSTKTLQKNFTKTKINFFEIYFLKKIENLSMCQCELLPKLYSTVQGKNPLSLSEGKSKATCAFPVYLSSSSSLYSVTRIHRLSLPPSLSPLLFR